MPMKCLMIGQVSKEYGAPITTGAAIVAIELSKQSVKDLRISLCATNISNNKAKRIKDFLAYGYSKNIFVYFWNLVKHPINSAKHIWYYKKKMGVNPFRYYFYEVNFGRAISNFNPDIIHVHGLTQYMPAFYASEGKVPIVATLHGYWHAGEERERLAAATMPFVSNITTLTKMAKKDILQDYPQVYNHFDIIANGADTNKFYFSKTKREEMRKQLGINDNTIVFITVASIQERKGQLKFVKFLYESQIENYRYLIIGKGDDHYIEEMKHYIEEHSLSEKVSLLGYVNNSDMYSYYSASDVYAHVSTNEGQSLSEMEAASTGLRVVVNESLVGTLPDDISDKDSTFYVLDYGDVDYGGFIKWTKEGAEKRHSVNYYSWHMIVEKYYDVYKRIINE